MHGNNQSIAAALLQTPSGFAAAFFMTSVSLLTGACLVSWVVVRFLPISDDSRFWFLIPFAVSTVLLAVGSLELIRAAAFVGQERQIQFRRCLLRAVVCGGCFLCVQTVGLWLLLEPKVQDTEAGVRIAAFLFAALHAIHVLVAVLFVVWIFLKALADRYDHEYFYGVTFCGWFWHGLGIVWVALGGFFTIAMATSMAQVSG